MTDMRVCRRCDRPMVPQHRPGPVPAGAVVHSARGLCAGCWSWADYNGVLADYPPLKRSAAEIAEEHVFLTGQGLSRDEIAARIGMKRTSMERALCRHRARTRPDGRTNDSLAVAS